MSFTVVRKPAAEAMLARIWNAARDRNGVTRAANQIDAVLKRNPRAVGEARSGSKRDYFVAPLAVHYEVVEMDRIVRVPKVWRID
jgi:plasmid stabilization system protein ParE